jgi:hypothetical protein
LTGGNVRSQRQKRRAPLKRLNFGFPVSA